jgi:hypothetical protein
MSRPLLALALSIHNKQQTTVKDMIKKQIENIIDVLDFVSDHGLTVLLENEIRCRYIFPPVEVYEVVDLIPDDWSECYDERVKSDRNKITSRSCYQKNKRLDMCW